MEWISVLDKLPKTGTMCKCKNYNREFAAIYSTTPNGIKKFFTLGKDEEVTHWKPLYSDTNKTNIK